MKPLVSILLLALLVGCSTASGTKSSNEAQGFDRANAPKIVEARTANGNWSFLVWSGGMMEATLVPGLSKEEVKEYIDSGRFGCEPFHYYHAEFVVGDQQAHQALLDAKWRYAERVNRYLLEKIKGKKPNQVITAQRASRVAD